MLVRRGEQAVNTEQHPRGGEGVYAENLEHSADQVWIKRRLPGRWAGVAFIRTREAVSLSDGPADASHLPAELKVVFAGPPPILMGHPDRRQLQHKRQWQEPEKKSGKSGPRRFRHCAIVYQAH